MSKKKIEDFTSSVSEIVEFYEGNNKAERKEPETALDPEEKEVPEIEKGFPGIDVSKKEFKTKRVQLLMKPTTHEALKELAEELREQTGNEKISVNEIINQVLESFLKGVEKL